jgi:2TM domain
METQNTFNPNSNDEKLWQIARKRAAFKKSLFSYFIVNSLLVAIWFVTSFQTGNRIYFWPIWPMLGWGVGLAFQYAAAYHNADVASVEKEFERLKNQQNQ